MENFLTGGATGEPLAGFEPLIENVLLPLATPVGWIVIILELFIGLAIVTGIRFDEALGVGAGLATVFLFAGQINPAAFYIVIHVVLVASPAGRSYVLCTRPQPSISSWAPWAIGFCGGIAIIGFSSTGSISVGSVMDSAAVLSFLGLYSMAVIAFLWRRQHVATP